MSEHQYRKSPRAQWMEYNEGCYFITICAKNMAHFFGKIRHFEMHLNAIGRIVEDELRNPQRHHKHVKVLNWVVMPNHIHAIVEIEMPNIRPELPKNHFDRTPSAMQFAMTGVSSHSRQSLLGAYIGSLKSAITRQVRIFYKPFEWQTRYHDHGILNQHELNKISEYINKNIETWSLDRYYNEE